MNKVVALAGNPNVGKSTIFNALTGMNQHTGNWPGKTVAKAEGKYVFEKETYTLVDLPGTYSLLAHSLEEEIARDYICFEEVACVVVVCDATCLERNLNLVLQTLEITNRVIVCVNLLDEANKKQIYVDLQRLSTLLKVPVVGTSARSKQGLQTLKEVIANTKFQDVYQVGYPAEVESVIASLMQHLQIYKNTSKRFIALRLLESYRKDNRFKQLQTYYEEVEESLKKANAKLVVYGYTNQKIKDMLVRSMVESAQAIAQQCVVYQDIQKAKKDQKWDLLLTSKKSGIPIMILLLCVIFWFTIFGANIPSSWLSTLFTSWEYQLANILTAWQVSSVFIDFLVHGVFRVLAWVISVMLPPMAIFFPLFTILEDFGYLPRIAFNLDHYFKKACTCGKQALTMCMGFGCNAVGVSGCRIIDSTREQKIAILTNNFVPCNGRFPTIMMIITMFFVTSQSVFHSFLSAFLLTAVVLLGVVLTFLTSFVLSKTLLKGETSSFTLELPPYRKPQFMKVIVRSIFDRTLKVLGRAVLVAAPAGCIIWLFANITIQDVSILSHFANFLDPLGKIMGMDGVILMAFIMGFPANEIVIPIMIMIYMASGNLIDLDTQSLQQLLIAHNWTITTAICTVLFTLLHWPCSTTCLTIYKETKSVKMTGLAFLLPTFIGVVCCILVASILRIL